MRQAAGHKACLTINSHNLPPPYRRSLHSSAGMNFYTFTNAQSVARQPTAAQGTQPTWLPAVRRPTPAQDSTERHVSPPWHRKRCLILFSLAMGVCLCVPSAISLFVYHQRSCHTTARPMPGAESEQQDAATAVPEVGLAPTVHPDEPPSSCSGASGGKPAKMVLTCMHYSCLCTAVHWDAHRMATASKQHTPL